MAVGRILTDFAGWTSAHGIPHIGSAQNNCLRCFWTVIFIASTSMFIFQMVLLIQKYTSYDVTVQTELKFEEREFPSVTLCNLNPFRKSKLNMSEDMEQLMANYTLAIQGSNSGEDLVDRWNFRSLNDTIAIQSAARDHLLFIAGNMSADIRNQMTYGLKDSGDFKSGFVLNCAFNTRPCKVTVADDSDFNVIDDPIYGKCFTFNFKAQYKSTRAGPLYGLRLLAVSNQDEYLPLTESAGVRVAVHGATEEPFPDAFGYNAAAGFTTSFGIKYIMTKRLPAPYGDCTDVVSGADYYYTDKYQVEGCFRSCFQKTVLDDCGCGDPRFKLDGKGGSYYCPAIGNQRDCVSAYSKSKSSMANSTLNDKASTFSVVANCSCPQPCTESTYGVTVSTALWPSDVYTPPECKSATENTPWTAGDAKSCTDWYKDNTMLIEVYYERMNYQMLSESEAYTMVNLISDMGGQLGLWMGISVITVVEFFSLCILVCLYCCNKPKDEVDEADEQDPNAFDGKDK